MKFLIFNLLTVSFALPSVYSDLSLSPLPNTTIWETFTFSKNHRIYTPVDAPWINCSFNFDKDPKYGRTSRIQFCILRKNDPVITENIRYLKVNYSTVSISVAYWGKPWIMGIGYTF